MKTIKNWAPEDRPRERLLANGAGTLSKAELLAILIGSGVPGKSAVDIMRTILADYGDSLMMLGKASVQELMRYEGIGEAKAVTIIAACQLANQRLKEALPKKMHITNTMDTVEYFRPIMQDLQIEECHLLLLDQGMAVKGSALLSRGGIAGASVDVRCLLRHAILGQAVSVVLCHNHPSGRKQPSRDDDNLTRKVNEACNAVGIRLIDHVIFAGDEYYSYHENGKI
ncbi:MAG: DNA repair protein RadC [Bacteroidaceae bacterium]|nr:DNA repair protein RadC [Bacteroidaceae bacterium]